MSEHTAAKHSHWQQCLNTQLPDTHTGGNVKMEDGGSNILHVVLEELHHCIRGNHWAMDGNYHMHRASRLRLSQSISHSCNEEGLPHPRPGGTDYSYTGTMYMCVRVLRGVSSQHSICKKITSNNNISMFTSCPGTQYILYSL